MTVVFEDERLYAALRAEAARTGRPATDVVVQAIREWLDAKADDELRADLEEARQEREREGGREAGDFLAQITASS